MLSVIPVARDLVSADVFWKNGGMSLPSAQAFSDKGDGSWEIGVTDTRGYVPMPNLDNAPYYIQISLNGQLPAGIEQDGGRWAQLHISNGERNINWNPQNEIYIEFPNEGANPLNLKVKNTIDGASQFEGVPFVPQKTYLFKFVKEDNKLVIYCDGVKVMESAEALSVFSGNELWFITLGNIGQYDVYKDYPLTINPLYTPPPEEPKAVWKNGGMSLPSAQAYSEMENGFFKLTATDTRGYVPMPNLDNAPYYIMLGMEGQMPSGAESDGGRWAQLHISNGERNPNWNPTDEIYIEIPNDGYNPKNITVKNDINGNADLSGVAFAPKKTYLFKFAKENNKLAVYCDGVKVMESAEALSVFSGSELWFITLGNQGNCDTFKDYPLFINPLSDTTEPPPFGDVQVEQGGQVPPPAGEGSGGETDGGDMGDEESSTPIPEKPTTGWKNGGGSQPADKNKGYEDLGNGYVKITTTDARGAIPTPNLDKAPYYMMFYLDKVVPGGIESEGGRWMQLHLSNGERNINWNPSGEIYIEIPNSGYNPLNINAKNAIDAKAQGKGVIFAPKTPYILKFAKENNKLVIYINGTKVFEGAEELNVFSGTNLWVTALGNIGDCDVYKDNPLYINMKPEVAEEPASYYYKGAKWGADGTAPARDIDFEYLKDGSTRVFIKSRYDTEGRFDDIGQSVSTVFSNPNKKFEINLKQEAFNFDTWQIIGLRPGDKSGAPADEPEVLCLEITNGPSFQVYYRKSDRSKVEIVPVRQFELGLDLKLNFEFTEENGTEKIKIYANNVLVGSSDDGEVVAFMKSETVKAICVGQTTYDEPNITVMKINNNPSEFEVIVPEEPDESKPDPYVDLVLTYKGDKVKVDGYLITVDGSITAHELTKALVAPKGTRIYVMTAKEELAENESVVDSTHSVMMLLDDEYETYVRSYNLYVVNALSADGSRGIDIGLVLGISIPSVLVLAAGAVAFVILKKRKSQNTKV